MYLLQCIHGARNRTHAGLITPKEALEEACRNLKAVCGHMKQTFRQEMDAHGIGSAAAQDDMET